MKLKGIVPGSEHIRLDVTLYRQALAFMKKAIWFTMKINNGIIIDKRVKELTIEEIEIITWVISLLPCSFLYYKHATYILGNNIRTISIKKAGIVLYIKLRTIDSVTLQNKVIHNLQLFY